MSGEWYPNDPARASALARELAGERDTFARRCHELELRAKELTCRLEDVGADRAFFDCERCARARRAS